MRTLALLTLTLIHGATGEGNTLGRRQPEHVASECTLSTPGPNLPACRNVLDADWQKANLADVAQKVTRMISGFYTVVEERQSSVACRDLLHLGDSTNKQLNVKYDVPEDVNLFPKEPTNQRYLVVAIFNPLLDQGCSERRYKVRKPKDQWKRLVSFMTVQTKVGMPDHVKDQDTVVAKWQMWVIAQDTLNPTTSQYRAEKIESGKFVSCGEEHATGKNWEFIGCDGATRLTQYFYAHKNEFRDFDQLLEILQSRNDSVRATQRLDLLKVLRGDKESPFKAAAWMRCGYLGCCAAQ